MIVKTVRNDVTGRSRNARTLRPRPHRLPRSTWLASNCVRAPLFLAATILCGSASLIVSFFEKEGKLQHRIAQLWASVSMRISGSSITIEGAERLQRQTVAVYCANHLSYMDTPAVFSSLPFQFRIVARSNLWSVPFIGWHLNRSGQIPVNVANPRASISSLSGGVKSLKDGMPLFIFPEGGRTRDGHPGAFMNGPAFMAIRARVPLVPMALVGTHELLPMHARQFYPTPVTLAVGEPIETTQYTLREVDRLTEELAAAITQLYYQHSYLQPSAVSALDDVSTPLETR